MPWLGQKISVEFQGHRRRAAKPAATDGDGLAVRHLRAAPSFWSGAVLDRRRIAPDLRLFSQSMSVRELPRKQQSLRINRSSRPRSPARSAGSRDRAYRTSDRLRVSALRARANRSPHAGVETHAIRALNGPERNGASSWFIGRFSVCRQRRPYRRDLSCSGSF